MEVGQRRALDVFLWLLVVAVAAIVLYTSVTPPSGDPRPLGDKVFHFLAYSCLNMSLLLAAVWAPVRGRGRFPAAAVRATVVVFAFGIGLEGVQAALPERHADILDVLANGSGAATALLLWRLWRTPVERVPKV